MMRLTLAACALVLSAVSVPAQPVTVIGPVTAGHCAAFNSTTVLRDGGDCSGGGIGGANTQVQYNNGGSFGGITGATSNGTTLTMASPIITGTPTQNGSGSGVISFATQAAAGTYNWNWPTTAGASGYLLTSGGGGATAMTWSPPVIRRSLQDFGACASFAVCGGQDDTSAIQSAWTWAATGVGGLDIIDIGGCYAVTGGITAPIIPRSFTARGIGQPCISDTGTGGATLSIGTTTRTVSGTANNGSGLIRLTVNSTADFVTGQSKIVFGVGGTTAANGTWVITVIDGTHIDLQGSTYSGAFTTGGIVVSANVAIVLIDNLSFTTASQTTALRINAMGYGAVINVNAFGYSGNSIYADATYTMMFEKLRLLSNNTGIKFFNGGGNSATVKNSVINGHANCGIEYDTTDHFRPNILWTNLESNLNAICIGGASPVIVGNEFENNTTDIYGPSNGGTFRHGIVISGNASVATTFVGLAEVNGLVFTGNRIQHGAGGVVGILDTITSLTFCSNDLTGGSTITAPWPRDLVSTDCANNSGFQRMVGYLGGFDATGATKYLFTNDGQDSLIGSSLAVSGYVSFNGMIGANQTSKGVADFRTGAARIISWGAAATEGMIEFWQGQGASAVARTMWLDTADSLNLTAQMFMPNMSSDTATADSTVCTATTGGKFLKGTGTLGVCLGTSGRQFKTAFSPMQAGLDEIVKLPLWNYRYLPGWGDGGERTQYGATAQDVETVLPDLVRHDSSGEAINYDIGAFLPIALRAIQQLKADNDGLHRKVDLLERRIRQTARSSRR